MLLIANLAPHRSDLESIEEKHPRGWPRDTPSRTGKERFPHFAEGPGSRKDLKVQDENYERRRPNSGKKPSL